MTAIHLSLARVVHGDQARDSHLFGPIAETTEPFRLQKSGMYAIDSCGEFEGAVVALERRGPGDQESWLPVVVFDRNRARNAELVAGVYRVQVS